MGHAALEPLQLSAWSQSPVDARHSVPAEARTLLGHSKLRPSHDSLGSHSPSDGRHVVPDATGAQVPSTPAVNAAMHASQSLSSPVPQTESQHTPSTQCPEEHEESVWHAAPCASFEMQVPASQKVPPAHWSFPPHEEGQLTPVPVQRYGEQLGLPGWPAATHASAEQVPALPSQSSGASQLPAAGRQTVPAGSTSSTGHVSAVPSHVSGTSHRPTAGPHTIPAEIGPHAPSAPPVRDAVQPRQSFGLPEPHSASQQTPSTQNPLAQLVAPAQGAPSGLAKA